MWVHVESSINGGFFGVSLALELILNPPVEFEFVETCILCLNNVPVIITTSDPNDFLHL
jgi:hypothetical protein